MKKRFLCYVCIIIILVFSTSCRGENAKSGSPSEVVNAFYTEVKDGNIEKASNYIAVKKLLTEWDIESLSGNISEVKVLKEEIGSDYSSDTAWVTVEVILDSQSSSALLVKQDGGERRIFLAKRDNEWKIVKRL